jgi:hypothetical protein
VICKYFHIEHGNGLLQFDKGAVKPIQRLWHVLKNKVEVHIIRLGSAGWGIMQSERGIGKGKEGMKCFFLLERRD